MHNLHDTGTKMMRRADKFLMLVQTEAIVFDIMHEHEGSMAATILFKAMQVDPTCLPEDLSQATWETLKYILDDRERPPWLRWAKGSPLAKSTAGGKIEGGTDG
jgi:hypothetical protein